MLRIVVVVGSAGEQAGERRALWSALGLLSGHQKHRGALQEATDGEINELPLVYSPLLCSHL